MFEVVSFFYDSYPGDVPERITIEINKFLSRKGTSNVIGTINQLSRISNWAEWSDLAYKHFQIKI